MIRGILALLFVLIFLTVSLILIPIAYLIGLFDRHARDVYAQSLVAWGFRVIGVIVGAKVTEKGREKLPRGEAALYVANHRSIFDIVLLDARMPAPTAIVAKKEIKKYLCFLHRYFSFIHHFLLAFQPRCFEQSLMKFLVNLHFQFVQ